MNFISSHSKIAAFKRDFVIIAAMMAMGLTTPAVAATFQFRQPVLGLVASPTAPAQQAVAEILVALTGGPMLPSAEVNLPYSYDLKQLLSVTGDLAYSSSNVQWSVLAGSLPAGLSLGADGVIAGQPTTKDLTGSNFQVKASYKGKDGQQAYTIVVNGAVLHVTQIAAGGFHTCALTTAGGVKCWGYNGMGQLGDNSKVNRLTPVSVSSLSSGVLGVAAGTYHTCAVITGGGVKCWGAGGSGELGPASSASTVPVSVTGLSSGVASLALGNGHSCALLSSGGVRCWGANNYGQLGNNSTTASATPVTPTGLTSGVSTLTSGNGHMCAVTNQGAPFCWGWNNAGQLGTGAKANSMVPVAVNTLSSGVAIVYGGYNHSCALMVGGGVKCWGANGYGQLGTNNTTESLLPTNVVGLSGGVSSMALGRVNGYFSCAAKTDGSAVCWGQNNASQLGTGITANSLLVPTQVAGLTSGVLGITAGSSHACVLLTNGTKCWGASAEGEVGDGSTTTRATPTDVAP